MIVPEIIYSTVRNRCPHCHQGRVFVNNNPYSFKNGFTMNLSCNHCGLKYERETGFFYGAMYVSYGLMSAVLILWFLADLLWFHMDALSLALSVTLTMLILFPVAFRWARSIWLNFFVRYDKSLRKKKISCNNVNTNSLKSK